MKHLFTLLAALMLAPPGALRAGDVSKPNVLLIVVDDLNTELGCYGNPSVKSPAVDRLAARGIRFDRAYCQYSLCNPSRISFLSGRRPETTGVYVLGAAPRRVMPDAIMLPQLFRQQGYFSAGAGKVYHTLKTNDPESWDDYQDGESEDAQEKAALAARYQRGDKTPRAFVLDGDGSRTRDGMNTRKIAGYLVEQAKSGKPFFLALGLHKPHLPWTAPKRFFDLYPSGSIPEPDSPRMIGIPAIALQTELAGVPPPPLRMAALTGYYACISFTDDNVRQVLDQLDQHQLWDSTVVVLLGDNGFHLGDHGGLWAKHTAFENATRVPLILAGAGVPRGRVVTQPVELLDLYPTLAELCGLPAPSGLEGKSLVPMMKSNKEDPSARAYSMIYHYDVATASDVLGRSVRTKDYRYTEWANEQQERELYLVGEEPAEYRNQADNPKARVQLTRAERLLRELKPPKPGPANRPEALVKGEKRKGPVDP